MPDNQAIAPKTNTTSTNPISLLFVNFLVIYCTIKRKDLSQRFDTFYATKIRPKNRLMLYILVQLT